MLPVCLVLRLAAQYAQGRLASHLERAALGVQILLACCAGALPGTMTLGPLHLDPLTSCWVLLWSLSLLTPERTSSPLGEAFAGLGLLCDDHALALLCFTPCLMDICRSTAGSWGRPWSMGLLAPAGSGLIVAAFLPGANALVPLAGLATLPAFCRMPVLAYSLFVPDLLVTTSSFWPVALVLAGGALCLCLPVSRVLSFWPLFLLGLTLSARAGGLSDSALATSEAFILSLALNGLSRFVALLRAPLPPLAGFLPFWLALHGVNGLAGLSPAWTAGAMILGLLIGVLMVRAWLDGWNSLVAGWHPPAANTGRVAGWADHALLPTLMLGLCLSICPGLLLGPMHRAALGLAGASPEIWRHWPIWSIAGGDGAFWYPALVFLVPALIVPALIAPSHAARHAFANGGFPLWPAPDLKLRLPWNARRGLASLRRGKNALLGRVYDAISPEDTTTEGRTTPVPTLPVWRRLDMIGARHALAVWLILLATALAWLGWTA